MRQVDVYVDQPSCIELHVRETVRLDRLTPTAADGYVAERHGALLAPGVTQVQLDKGLYHFRTLDDAQLRVISGGVQVASMSDEASRSDGHWMGAWSCGRVPALRVVDDTAGAPRSAWAIHTGAAARTWYAVGVGTLMSTKQGRREHETSARAGHPHRR